MAKRSEKSLSGVLGDSARELREAREMSQDEVASAMRRRGFEDWSRATVSKLERGTRDTSLNELVALSLVLVASLEVLLNTRKWVTVSPRLSVAPAYLDRFLSGDVSDVGVREFAVGAWEYDRSQMSEALQQVEADGRPYWPDASPIDLLDAALDARGEAERKMARVLGIEPLGVAVMARRLWEKSLTDERELRGANQADPASKTLTRGQRGHITRELRRELEDLLENL